MSGPAARKLTAREYADAANCPVCEEWRLESIKLQAENERLKAELKTRTRQRDDQDKLRDEFAQRCVGTEVENDRLKEVIADDLGFGFGVASQELDARISFAENAALRQQLSQANQDAGRWQGQAEAWQQRAEIAEGQLKQQGDAVALHHAQRGNDKCWENDNELYRKFGLEPHDKADLPTIDEHCRNCNEYRRGLYANWLPAEAAEAKGGSEHE